MIMIVSCLLIAVTAGAALLQIFSYLRLRRYVEGQLAADSGDYRPCLSVILPCKGLDPDFEENIRKLLGQSYFDPARRQREIPHFEVIFAVKEESDAAYPVLTRLARESKAVPVCVVVAGSDSRRAEKINNQLKALEQVRVESEVLVFVDSDVIAGSNFLRDLVAPLADDEVGATSGYRFYIPHSLNVATILRCLWNRLTAWELVDPRLSFAWGGAMAIRKSVFDAARVKGRWERSADDDLVLTTAVKELGLQVRFAARCLVASHGDIGFADCWQWVSRQLILTKVYYRGLWVKAIRRACLMVIWLAAYMATIIQSLATGQELAVLAWAAGSLLLLVELVLLLAAQRLWELILGDHAGRLRTALPAFCLAVPLAHLILPWMTLYSLLTNRIHWRGVTYDLLSQTETVVL